MFDITKKKLMYDNILIRIVDIQRMDEYIIDIKKDSEKPELGEVISVGSGRLVESTGEVIPCVVSVGDIVMFNRYASTKYRNSEDKKDYYIVREEDIIAY